MKDQTNEEPLDPMPGELPVTAGRPGPASAGHVESRRQPQATMERFQSIRTRCSSRCWTARI